MCARCSCIKLSAPSRSGALILPGDVQSWTNAPIYAQRQRLSEEMVCRYRHAGEGRAASRRTGNARSRRPGGAGPGRSQHRHRQPEAFRPDGQALGCAPGARRRGAPGRRRQGQRPGRQERDGRFGPGQRGPSGGHGILQAPGGAVRRHRHHPRGRCGRAGAGGHARRDAAVHRRGPEKAAHLCARAPDRCRRGAPGHDRHFTVPEYAGPRIHRHPGGQRRCGRQRQRHPAAAIPGRQCARR